MANRKLHSSVERQFRRLLLGSCDALPKALNKLDSIQILPTGSKSTRTSRPYCFPQVSRIRNHGACHGIFRLTVYAGSSSPSSIGLSFLRSLFLRSTIFFYSAIYHSN